MARALTKEEVEHLNREIDMWRDNGELYWTWLTTEGAKHHKAWLEATKEEKLSTIGYMVRYQKYMIMHFSDWCQLKDGEMYH